MQRQYLPLEIFPLTAQTILTRKSHIKYGKLFMVILIFSFRSYRKLILNNFHQQENESTADLHKDQLCYPDKYNYSQCLINTHKVDLFIHAVKHFTVFSLAREQPSDLAYERLLDNVKSHEAAVAKYHHHKKSRQDSMGFLARVSNSTDVVHSSEK